MAERRASPAPHRFVCGTVRLIAAGALLLLLPSNTLQGSTFDLSARSAPAQSRSSRPATPMLHTPRRVMGGSAKVVRTGELSMTGMRAGAVPGLAAEAPGPVKRGPGGVQPSAPLRGMLGGSAKVVRTGELSMTGMRETVRSQTLTAGDKRR